jgi:hypothetical protein
MLNEGALSPPNNHSVAPRSRCGGKQAAAV